MSVLSKHKHVLLRYKFCNSGIKAYQIKNSYTSIYYLGIGVVIIKLKKISDQS